MNYADCESLWIRQLRLRDGHGNRRGLVGQSTSYFRRSLSFS